MKICVCLSIGRHPVSGRARMAEADRVALELALSSRADITAVYAGPDTSVLRDYLGMGVAEIHRIDTGLGDPLGSLASFIKKAKADLVLTGTSAESGMSSGMLPYLLAEALGWPILAGVTGFDLSETLEVTQIASGGRRRARSGRPPAVLSIDPRAAKPRLSSLAASRSGRVICLAPDTEVPVTEFPASMPARNRSVRLRPGKAGTRSATAIHTDLAAKDAARVILEFLQAEGHFQPPHLKTSDGSTNA